MYIAEWGPQDGPLVLLLHALGCHSGWFDGVGPLLAERGYRVMAPDLRGHGDTPWADSYRFADYAADVEAVVGARPYALVGHSMGGYIGLVLAARGVCPPERLVVADMKTGSTPEELEGLRAASQRPGRTYGSLEEAVSRYKLSPPEHRAPAEALGGVAARCFRQAPAGGAPDGGADGGAPDGGGAWTEKFDRRALAIEPVEPFGLVGQVKCPVLFVRGEFSVVMPAEPAAELAAGAGARLLTMPGLYHHLPLEDAAGFAALSSGC